MLVVEIKRGSGKGSDHSQVSSRQMSLVMFFFSLVSEGYKDAFHGKRNYVQYIIFPEALKLYIYSVVPRLLTTFQSSYVEVT